MCTGENSCVGCVTQGADNDVTCTLFSSITGTSELVGATAYYIENRSGTEAYNRFEYQCLPKHLKVPFSVEQRILLPDLSQDFICDFSKKNFYFSANGFRDEINECLAGSPFVSIDHVNVLSRIRWWYCR